MIDDYPPKQQKDWPDVISALANVAALIFTVLIFVMRETNVPIWFYAAPFIFVGGAVFVLVRKKLLHIISIQLRNRKAKKMKKELLGLLERFRTLTSGNSVEGIRIPLQKLGSYDNLKGSWIFTDGIRDIHELWISYLIDRIKLSAVNSVILEGYLKEVLSIAQSFSRIFYEKAFEQIRMPSEQQIDPNIKREIDMVHSHYVDYLRRLKDFTEKAIRECKLDIPYIYIDFPKPL